MNKRVAGVRQWTPALRRHDICRACDPMQQLESYDMTQTPADLTALSFEDALRQLEQIVQALEQGNVPLERSIEMYERGAQLRAHCDRLLKQAEEKVEKIQLGADGRAQGTTPLDPES